MVQDETQEDIPLCCCLSALPPRNLPKESEAIWATIASAFDRTSARPMQDEGEKEEEVKVKYSQIASVITCFNLQ
eukprot:760926-Hanusia_phi.AAC.1